MDKAEIKKYDSAHVFHSWSAQSLIDPVAIAGGSGSWFWDYDGKRYLDFASQLVNLNLGHQHPKLVAAIQEQAAKMCMIAPGFAVEARSEAARLIAERAPGDLDMVFFTNGGAEATENAVRMARLHTGRQKVLTMYRSYHGSTSGAIAFTGDPRRWPNEPTVGGVVHFHGPYLYRSPFSATNEVEESERALKHLDETIMLEGATSIAAILIETVVGTNGILIPPPGYLQGIRDLCDRHGIIMICDEVMAGFGRCGEWFAVNAFDVVPDLIAFAKGSNSGYVPVGGVVISRRISDTFNKRAYPGGLTYSGHALACGSVVASINIFEEEGILDHVKMLAADVFKPELEALKAKHPSVGDVRGIGAFWAIELIRNTETREMFVPFNASGDAAKPMLEVVAECKANGVWPFVHFNRIQVTPPLNTSADDVRHGIAVIDAALDIADRYVTN